MSSRLAFALELIFLYLLPFTLIWIYPPLLAYRHILFVLGVLYLLLRFLTHHLPIATWGWGRVGFFGGAVPLLLTSLILPLLTLLILKPLPAGLARQIIGDDLLGSPLYLRLPLYILFSVPIQELIFRGYATWRLQQLSLGQLPIIAITSFLFIAAHLPFRSPLMLAIVAIIGPLYSWVYVRHHNLWSIMLAHATVGSLLLIVRAIFLA